MNKTISILVLLAAFSAAPVFATGSGSYLYEIPIADFVHLGDTQPSWNITIHIPQWRLRRSNYVAIEFVGVGVWEGTSSNIIVNGRKYALPTSEPLGLADIAGRGKSVIPIPVGVLTKGKNTIIIESGSINNVDNLYDDFDLANIVLVMSR